MLATLRYFLGRLGGWPRRIAALICLTLALASALSAPARHREPAAPDRGRSLARRLPASTRAVPVPIADARIRDLVSAGDHVDLYVSAADGSADALPPGPVAQRLLVLAVLPSTTPDTGAELVVAAGAADTQRISANLRQLFAVVLDPP